MALWHQSIEDDKEFNAQLAYNLHYVRSNRSRLHPALCDILHNVRYSRASSDYRLYGAQDVYKFNDVCDDEPTEIFNEIGRVIVNELAERNPKYIERIMLHALKLICDNEFAKLETRMASIHDTPHHQPRKLVNDDYDYWWEFDGSSVVIMCNYDGMPESGLDRIEFEFDDEDERQSAIDEAEKIVRGLNNDEIPLSKFFKDVSPQFALGRAGEKEFVFGYAQNFNKMEVPK